MSWGEFLLNAREVAWELVTLGGFRYPPFVYGGPLRRGDTPVFCFHGTEDAEQFERALAHLADNGYRTLSTEELYAAITRRQPVPERVVLLTFDDGERSIWTVALPLLKRYGMRATAFIVPGRIPEGERLRPTLEDVWEGRLSHEQFLRQTTNGSPALMTWQEVQAVHRSGVVDIQSHSLSHALVFTEPRVIDFVRPELLRRFHPFSFFMLHDGEQELLNCDTALGTPIYRAAPRLAAPRRYLESPKARQACIEHVRSHGGPAFFRRTSWRRELRQVESAARRRAGRPMYEPVSQFRAALVRELVASKRQIEAHLPGHRVRHFCYPWGEGRPEVMQLAHDAGYVSGFWLDARGYWSRLARIGYDPHLIPRLGEIWIRALPGSNRVGLAELLVAKARRRLRQGSAYLTHT